MLPIIAQAQIDSGPVVVAVCLLILVGVIMVIAMIKCASVDDILKLWGGIGALLGLITGSMGAYFFTRDANGRFDASIAKQNQAVVSQLEQSGQSLAAVKSEVQGLSSKLESQGVAVEEMKVAATESKETNKALKAVLDATKGEMISLAMVKPSFPSGLVAYPVSGSSKVGEESPRVVLDTAISEQQFLGSLDGLVETSVAESEERKRFAKALKSAVAAPKDKRLDFIVRLLLAAQQKNSEQRAEALTAVEGELARFEKEPEDQKPPAASPAGALP